MRSNQFFDNPAYRDYVRLLWELHLLGAACRDESPDADELRERMDLPGESLSGAEVRSVKGISADFYWLTDPLATKLLPMTPKQRAHLKATMDASDRGDFEGALSTLRKVGTFLRPADLAYLRGRIWDRAGELQIAIGFFRRAFELAPGNSGYELMLLHALHQAGHPEAGNRATEILEQPEQHAAESLLGAVQIVLASTRGQEGSQATESLQQLAAVLQEAILRLSGLPLGDRSRLLLAQANALSATCSKLLGDSDAAAASIDAALASYPEYPPALIQRGILLYATKPDEAAADFRRALDAGSKVVWPYFYLAHHALGKGLLGDCLRFCTEALKLPSSDGVKAELTQWMAIALAELGGPPSEVVTALFAQAIDYAPNNQEIRENLRSYNEALSSGELGSVRWRKADPRMAQSFGSTEYSPELEPLIAA